MTPFWALLAGILIGTVVSAIASLALVFGTAYVCELDREYQSRCENCSDDDYLPEQTGEEE